VGDYVWVRGIFQGDEGSPLPEECDVDVFSRSTQYKITVRKDMVVYYGPEWWPPKEGDLVITDGTGQPWRFYMEDGQMVAYTLDDPDSSARATLPAGLGDAEIWRSCRLIARDGKPVDY
jgi:hypothetical protein